jgi:hypothetical protein
MRPEFLTQEGHATVAPVACGNADASLVDEFHVIPD